MEQLQHFCHPEHPLIFNEETISDKYCYGCREPISGSFYSCTECTDFYHHKLCAELPLGMYHPLHPIHSLILFLPWRYDNLEFSKCKICKESHHEYAYRCSRCDYNFHIKCGSLVPTMEAKAHDHPSTSTGRMELKHFSHSEHPLIFSEDDKRGYICFGCQEQILGPSYSCIECGDFYHHKSCAELPLGFHHPLHPIHPLVLFPEWNYENDEEFSKCQVCKQFRNEYTYGCSRCNFNLHNRCASLPLTMTAKIHDHQLILLWRWIPFTCDFCGKKGEGLPYLCNLCGFWCHRSCASLPHKVKVVRHKHLLNLIHSLQLHQSNSPFCYLCARNVDTNYGLYCCSKCDFFAHLNCVMDEIAVEDKNLLELKEEENEDVDFGRAYEVKNIKEGEDKIEIATEIEHFSHEHSLKLIDEVINNEKCNGCVRAIHPPFYSCAKCSFFLHKSCAELPQKIRHPLHQHPLTLLPQARNSRKWFWCDACWQCCNGFIYTCDVCWFELDVQCSLVEEFLTHPSHEHRLILSKTNYKQSCNSCGYRGNQVFSCTTCEFALDFKCVTLPHTTRYKQHEHPFALYYTAEDDSGEYYCDICEEERDPKHWFYSCANCSYLAHPRCILGKNPNCK
nr:uncharacterized protein LOC112015105 [Quercus suber]